MIAALIALIGLLLGGSNTQTYLIDELDVGIKKEITDKDRKKDLQNILGDYQKVQKSFLKEKKKQLKILSKATEDKTTSKEYLDAFFDKRMNAYIEFDKYFINKRIILQNEITDEEWAQIMLRSTEAAEKIDAKEQKKINKGKIKDPFDKLEKTIRNTISNAEKNKDVMDALEVYKSYSFSLAERLANTDVITSDLLADKYAPRELLDATAKDRNMERRKLFNSYTTFFFVLSINTTEDEWNSLVKEFNKTSS